MMAWRSSRERVRKVVRFFDGGEAMVWVGSSVIVDVIELWLTG